jgi:hypothetical protein
MTSENVNHQRLLLHHQVELKKIFQKY